MVTLTPHKANLRRSVALFRAFRSEQSDPDWFYGALADDSARQVASYAPLPGATLLDVGGGPGYFADAFEAAGARYVGIDPDVGELSARGDMRQGMLLGSGTELPIRSSTVDAPASTSAYATRMAYSSAPPPWLCSRSRQLRMATRTSRRGRIRLSRCLVVGSVSITEWS